MKSFKSFIAEMAPPSSSHRNKTYFHGTSKIKYINGILDNGIQPPDLSTRDKNYLTPVEGKVYITENLRYAVIYALGGVYIGHQYTSRDYAKEPFGFVCVIDGQDLKDLDPDEDVVGKFVYEEKFDWLNELADEVLRGETYEYTAYDAEDDDIQWEESMSLSDAVRDGEYDAFAHAGKIIIPHLTDEEKLALIDAGAHIAHHGAINPVEIWKIDKKQSTNLVEDCSNFWELAERIR